MLQTYKIFLPTPSIVTIFLQIKKPSPSFFLIQKIILNFAKTIKDATNTHHHKRD